MGLCQSADDSRALPKRCDDGHHPVGATEPGQLGRFVEWNVLMVTDGRCDHLDSGTRPVQSGNMASHEVCTYTNVSDVVHAHVTNHRAGDHRQDQIDEVTVAYVHSRSRDQRSHEDARHVNLYDDCLNFLSNGQLMTFAQIY